MATWVDGRPAGVFGGYKGWLSTTMVAFVLTLVGLGSIEGCDATGVV